MIYATDSKNKFSKKIIFDKKRFDNWLQEI